MDSCVPSRFVAANSQVADAAPGLAKYVSMVLTNPAPGREDEFNDWYTHDHIPDVLTIPGIVAATRYRHVAQGGKPAWGGFRYMAIYELETDDLPGLFATLLSRMGTAMMPTSASMERRRAFYDWEVMTPKLVASAQPAGATAASLAGTLMGRGGA